MKKVLFIAYDFPPCEHIGGALRSEKFVQYLPEFGWKPIVVSLKASQNEGLEPDIIRFPSTLPYSKPYNFNPYGWAWNLYRNKDKLLKDRDIRIIYVSCPPFPPAVTASLYKKKSNIPLVIDFRDAWILNPLPDKNLAGKIIKQKFFPYIEKKILCESDIFITNTPSMLNAYSAHYPELKNKIKLIPNGFDEADFIVKKQTLRNQKMTLLHCGRFGASGRDPSILFHGLKKLKEQGCRITLHLLGEDNFSISELVKSFKLQSIVRVTGPAPHDKAINKMHDADVLVVYQNESQKTEISAIAGKTYEYLRIGKPILAIAPPGDNLNIIKQYALRYETVSNYSVDEIIKAISNLYDEWNKESWHSGPIINKDFINCYNRRFLSEKLAEIFNSLI